MLPSNKPLTPEEILVEVRKFIPESVKNCQKEYTHEVTKGALLLLKNLPAARNAVLEYLRKVFFSAVNRQVCHTHPGTVNDEPITAITVPEIHRVLIEIVSDNPQAWSCPITNWSLDLLGKLSKSFSKRAKLTMKSTINDCLKYWLSCKTTRTLMDLSAKCIKYLLEFNQDETDNCMNIMTELMATHSPYLDWVVAHIGSYFPQLIIKNILFWGLKDFSVTGTQENSQNILHSVVGILEHLATSHLYEINDAFLQLFKWSLNEDINDDESTRKQKTATVPYLLKFASLSPSLLLKVITKILLQTLFPVRSDIIPRLATFASDWCHYFDNQPEVLIELTVNLALACEQEAWQIISILLDTSLNTSNIGYHGVNAATTVKSVCREILEMILQKIDLIMRMNGPHSASGIALLTSIKQDLSLITPLLTDSHPLKVQTAVRLISLLGAHSSNVIISSASYLIRNASTDFHLAAFVRLVAENVVVFPIIQSEPENILSGHGYFNQTLEQALRDIQYSFNDIKHHECDEPRQLFKNLTTLLKWENSHSSKVTILQSKFISRAIHSNLEQITQLLNKTQDFELAHSIAQTLNLLSNDNSNENSNSKSNYTYSVDLTLKLTKSIVRYFFICIREDNILKKQRGVKISNRLLSLITSRSSCARILAIRELIENSLYGEPSEYFGAKVTPNDETNNFSLLHQNHKHGTSVMLAQRHSSVFHAGVIGQGPRRNIAQNNFSKEIIDLNSLLLLDTIKACCMSDESNNQYPNLDAITMVSLLLVELISPDVMYNGLPWPDEEFTKVTVERDLKIRRSFQEVPLIWTLLELTARHRPALTYCSVLLRAITATVISNWNLAEGSRLINIMVLGQLLPTPLNCLTDVLPILTPHQINVVMKECVWAYMHENVPSPALFTLTEGASIAWRDPDVSTPNVRFTNILRLFILANIAKTGMLYFTFFFNENKEV
ncbi:integrator complex subunit 5-like [Chelonus insularis]|uniref:integrator complex subunit 5-like n=1 Tax=Chelonus insularis TaxID=460826 RepID=UPI00158F343F|nr:integrator complex subunit 5-like [Chelonus insularis]